MEDNTGICGLEWLVVSRYELWVWTYIKVTLLNDVDHEVVCRGHDCDIVQGV